MQKKGNIKNNLEYFWMYYKWQIIAAVIVVALGIYFLRASLTEKDTALSVMLLDCHTNVSQEQMEKDALDALDLDKKEYQVQVQNNLMFEDASSGTYAMTSLSRFLADIGSEKLDVCGMVEEDFLKYDKSGTFLDLRECFDEEILTFFEDALLKTQDGRVIGLYADKLAMMKEYECYGEGAFRGVIGIIYNAPHKKAAQEYLMYLAE